MEEFASTLDFAAFLLAATFALAALVFASFWKLSWVFAPFVLAALRVGAWTLAHVLLASETFGAAGIALDLRRRRLLYQLPPGALMLQYFFFSIV